MQMSNQKTCVFVKDQAINVLWWYSIPLSATLELKILFYWFQFVKSALTAVYPAKPSKYVFQFPVTVVFLFVCLFVNQKTQQHVWQRMAHSSPLAGKGPLFWQDQATAATTCQAKWSTRLKGNICSWCRVEKAAGTRGGGSGKEIGDDRVFGQYVSTSLRDFFCRREEQFGLGGGWWRDRTVAPRQQEPPEEVVLLQPWLRWARSSSAGGLTASWAACWVCVLKAP